MCFRTTKVRDEPGDVGGEDLNAVVGNVARLLAEVIAALIRRDHSIASLRQGKHWVEHATPKLRKAMQCNDKWTIRRASNSAMQPHSIGEHIVVLNGDSVDYLRHPSIMSQAQDV